MGATAHQRLTDARSGGKLAGMPIYEYRCRGCGEKHDRLVRSSDADPGACPRCNGHELERLLSTFGIGSGPASASGATGSMCANVCAPAGRCMRQG